MRRTLTLRLQTPAGEEQQDSLIALRLETPDGARGVLPGHESALVLLAPGVGRYRVEDASEPRYFAAEAGLGWIGPEEVRLVSRWIARAPSLAALVRLVERRREVRGRLEESARRQVERHEVATRRALAKLQREVSW